MTPLAQIVVRDWEKYPICLARFIERKVALKRGLIDQSQFERDLLAIVELREAIDRQVAYVLAADEYGPLIYADRI